MKIMKKILIILAILAMATITSCELATPVDTGNSVDVEMGGGEGGKAPTGGITGDPAVQWIKIRVLDYTGMQVGMGTLERTGGGTLAFNKKITGLPEGTLDFMVWAGSTTGLADTVLWFGGATKVISVNTSISITVATATGGRKGPATGGIIFYVTKPDAVINTGWTYIEAAPSDQSTETAWITGGDTQTTSNGNTLTAIGTGKANTGFMAAQAGYTGGAAKVCLDYTGGGFADWFLPSQDELNAMYGKKVAIGGFASFWYWSSSEFSVASYGYAWVQDFSDGSQNGYSKDNGIDSHVRAVRAF